MEGPVQLATLIWEIQDDVMLCHQTIWGEFNENLFITGMKGSAQ